MPRLDTPPPIPPAWLPPGRTELLEGRGETFFRDSGPDTAKRGTLLLLHGWTVTADLNWVFAYRPLVEAGYRVIAPDHRGHGRGLRTQAAFRLEDCARDAAQLVRQLNCGPVTLVGYSMGGAIAQLVARDNPELVEGLVLCATALHWTGPLDRVAWFGMRMFQWVLRMFSNRVWRGILRQVSRPDAQRDAWILSEYSRGSADAIAEAGQDLGRFDSRPWIGSIGTPIAVVIPDHDRLIPPARQREMAATVPNAVSFIARGDHGDMLLQDTPLVDAIRQAVEDVRQRRPISATPLVGRALARLGRRSLPPPEIA